MSCGHVADRHVAHIGKVVHARGHQRALEGWVVGGWLVDQPDAVRMQSTNQTSSTLAKARCRVLALASPSQTRVSKSFLAPDNRWCNFLQNINQASTTGIQSFSEERAKMVVRYGAANAG